MEPEKMIAVPKDFFMWMFAKLLDQVQIKPAPAKATGQYTQAYTRVLKAQAQAQAKITPEEAAQTIDYAVRRIQAEHPDKDYGECFEILGQTKPDLIRGYQAVIERAKNARKEH